MGLELGETAPVLTLKTRQEGGSRKEVKVQEKEGPRKACVGVSGSGDHPGRASRDWKSPLSLMTQLEVRDIFPSTFQTRNQQKPEDLRELAIENRVQGEDCVPWRQDWQTGEKAKSWGSGVCLPKFSSRQL